ncbi:retrovirus-related pol polyprotein from transposon TNT 1-94 [Tanacetum coccineum]
MIGLTAASPSPVPLPRPRRARISVRPQTPMSAAAEALITAVAIVLPSSPPPYPLTPLSSPLPQIPSPPLPLPSPPLPLPAPSSPLLLPATNHKEDVPVANVPPRKKLCLTAPTPRVLLRRLRSDAITNFLTPSLVGIVTSSPDTVCNSLKPLRVKLQSYPVSFQIESKSSASFRKPLASEVALTSHMLKVAKLLPGPEETLILPFGGVNADDTANKESSPLKQVADTQHAEEPIATADITKGVDASESAEVLGNRPKPADVEKDFGIKSPGNVSFDELYGNALNMGSNESTFDTESEIKFVRKVDPKLNIDAQGVGSLIANKDLTEADSDLKSMPDDEIESVSGFEIDDDNEDDHSEHKFRLSKTDEVTTDNVLDELVDMANSQDANINAFSNKPAESDPLGHFQANFNSNSARVNTLESFISQKLDNKLDESVPRMVTDVFEERIPDLLYDTLKNILPQLIKDSVKQSLPKFNKIVKKTLKAEIPNLILKPLNKEFNALNNMKSRRVPRDIMVINAKELQKKIEKNAFDILELVNLIRELVILIDPVLASAKADTERENVSTQAQSNQFPTPLNSFRPLVTFNNISYDQFTANLFSSGSSEYSPTSPLKGRMTLEDAKAQMEEIKRLVELKAEKEKSEKRLKEREEEFHLATTPQLIRIQNAIKKNSAATKEILAECKASASNEGVVVCKASASIEGLAECKALASNLRRIQVKDIVKELENYLNTLISWEWIISCLKPGELIDSDTCIWTLSHDDKFSMNSVRNHIDELSLLSLSLSTRWCKIIPRNVNIFMWRMFLDRIPNRLNLSSRGLDIDSIMCPFYNVSMESSAHIFFSDDAASAVWHLVRVWSGSIFPSFSHVESEIFGFSHGTPQRKGPRLRHLCCSCWNLMAFLKIISTLQLSLYEEK